MIDIKIHEHTVSTVNEFLVSNEQFGDDWRKEKTGLNDLLAEVKRLRRRESSGCVSELLHVTDIWSR